MAKRYKKGNRKKKSKDTFISFYERERQLNQLITKFINDYHNLTMPAVPEEYDNMDGQRLKIKYLLDIQASKVYKQSRRRKSIYYEQLNRFKYWYVAWKAETYYIYLNKKYYVPLHLQSTLNFYQNISSDIISTIYML